MKIGDLDLSLINKLNDDDGGKCSLCKKKNIEILHLVFDRIGKRKLINHRDNTSRWPTIHFYICRDCLIKRGNEV